MATEETKSPLVITELQVDNVKRIRAVRIRPDGAVVTIGGRNAQGKSSTLDAIEMVFGGTSALPEAPIRMGARQARILADLGEIVVERTMSAKGTKLEVRGRDGAVLRSPQGILDELYSKISFDPLRFTRMKPAEQDATLKQVLGLDFTELDQQRAAAYDERTRTNRTVKELDVRLNAAPEHRDAPAAEVSIAELAEERKRRQVQADKAKALSDAVTEASDNHQEAMSRHTEAEQHVRDLEDELAAAKAAVEQRAQEMVAASAALDAAANASDNFSYDDPEEIDERLKTVEETNRKVRENAARAEIAADLAKAEERAELLNGAIKDIDEQKAAKLAAAKFPIDGLAFDESGPTLNGVPLAQASTAQQIRLSVALGFALNPRLKVLLIREGSSLDDDSLKLLAELAEQAGGQLWIERVSSDGKGCSVLIEDGEIKADEKAAE